MSLSDKLLILLDKTRAHFHKRQALLATPENNLLSEELRQHLSALDIRVDPSMPPAQQYWSQNMLNFKETAANSDPMNFLSWNVISGTMFVKYAKYSRFEYGYLKHLPDWPRWHNALKEDDVGNPGRCPFDTSTSCNLVHHAYHLAKFEQATKTSIKSLAFILEFGGGYGSMCRLVHRLGFVGRYLIIDLPAFSALQEYFLKSVGIRVLSKEQFLDGENGVYCASDIDTAAEMASNQKNGLLLATWSLSEAPLDIRAKVLKASDYFDVYLLAFQPFFEDIDNVSYFSEWQSNKPEIDWHLQTMQHIKNQRYLFGKKR